MKWFLNAWAILLCMMASGCSGDFLSPAPKFAFSTEANEGLLRQIGFYDALEAELPIAPTSSAVLSGNGLEVDEWAAIGLFVADMVELVPTADAPYVVLRPKSGDADGAHATAVNIGTRKLEENSVAESHWTHNDIPYSSLRFTYTVESRGVGKPLGPYDGLVVLRQNPADRSWALSSFDGKGSGVSAQDREELVGAISGLVGEATLRQYAERWDVAWAEAVQLNRQLYRSNLQSVALPGGSDVVTLDIASGVIVPNVLLESVTWPEAQAYCANLIIETSLGTKDNFRLIETRDVKALVDDNGLFEDDLIGSFFGPLNSYGPAHARSVNMWLGDFSTNKYGTKFAQHWRIGNGLRFDGVVFQEHMLVAADAVCIADIGSPESLAAEVANIINTETAARGAGKGGFDAFVEAFARQVKACWTPPVDAAAVTLSVQFARDGQVVGAPTIISSSGSDDLDASAQRAIARCGPYAFGQLPYEEWSTVQIAFETPGNQASQAVPLSRTDLMLAQTALQTLGYDPGGTDGLSGPKTRAAIAAWQRATGRPETTTLSTREYDELVGAGGGNLAQLRNTNPDARLESLLDTLKGRSWGGDLEGCGNSQIRITAITGSLAHLENTAGFYGLAHIRPGKAGAVSMTMLISTSKEAVGDQFTFTADTATFERPSSNVTLALLRCS